MAIRLRKITFMLVACLFLLLAVSATGFTARAEGETTPAEQKTAARWHNADDPYLYIICRGKVGNKWTIVVGGPNPYAHWEGGIEYNAKMCNFNDAKNWKNLRDVKTYTETIPGYQGYSVTIQENFFATSITFSYTADGFRYITYADQLNVNDYSMRIAYNTVAA